MRITSYDFYAALIAQPDALPPFSLHGKPVIIVHFEEPS